MIQSRPVLTTYQRGATIKGTMQPLLYPTSPPSHKLLSMVVLLCLVLSACQPASPDGPDSTPTQYPLEACQIQGQPGFNGARCGNLAVLEDRQNPAGRTISLKLAVLPAISRTSEPDPLFLLAGGPGQAATEAFSPILATFYRINQKRDLVLIDQRGTGANNPLSCPDLPEEADLEEYLEPWVEACLDQIEADPRFYTTSSSVEDLEQARIKLGYEQINLYGVSYGTRLALAYLREYPQNVRSLILDGIVPQEEPVGLGVARDAQRALDLIFQRCAEDEACGSAFPDLAESFKELNETLTAEATEIVLPHPSSGELQTLHYDQGMLATTVRLLSYAPETAALLPLLIHHAHTQNDYTRLASQYLLISDQVGESVSVGLNYSVICSEDYPFLEPAEVERANAGTYLGNIQSAALIKVCERWPASDPPSWAGEPVRSEHPVLLLSGEADPVTPPEYGEAAARTLPNSLHLIVPGQGHNVIYRGCLPNLAAQFLEQPTIEELNTGCVQIISPMPFFINFAGPAP
jgi:pimeloyl-ACP methyl ester carboxylesterase